ncbi:hypothetical protein ACFL34_04850, partial [Candidatus Sumerlaeota bacterium]
VVAPATGRASSKAARSRGIVLVVRGKTGLSFAAGCAAGRRPRPRGQRVVVCYSLTFAVAGAASSRRKGDLTRPRVGMVGKRCLTISGVGD